MQFKDVLKTRHSIRRFSSSSISWDKVAEVLDAARYAPFAGNIPAIKLILVSDRPKIQQIAQAAVQDFIAEAPYIVVVVSDSEQVNRLYQERGAKYVRQEAGAAIQNMLLKAHELGLASCWIGAFYDNAIKRILRIPDDMEVEALIPLAKKPIFVKGKGRKNPDLKNILSFEMYGEKMGKSVKKLDT